MTGSDDLAVFVREGLMRGVPRADIERALLTAGWRPEQVKDALRAYADVPFSIPVPSPRPYQSARDAFMYVVLFTTLYVGALSLGSLLFALVDRTFPAPGGRFRDVMLLQHIRWSVAWLVVTVPVFAFVQQTLSREIAKDAAKRDSKIRRQITYVTLFIASATLLVDVSTLVYSFLGGELTTRFVLKAVIVAAVAGAGFWYYLRDIRAAERAEGS